MKKLDDISIGKKLIGSFLVTVIILILVGVEGYIGVVTTNQYLEQMYDEQLVPNDILNTMDSELWHIRGYPPAIILIPETRESSRAESAELMKSIDSDLKTYDQYIISDEEREIYNEAVRSWGKYKEAFAEFNTLVDSGDIKTATTALTTGSLVNERRAFSGAIAQLVEKNRNDAEFLKNEGILPVRTYLT